MKKLISTVFIVIMLIFAVSTVVSADNTLENDLWVDVNIVEENNTNDLENGNEILFENIEEDNEVLFGNIEEENEVEENEEYNNLYTTRNYTTSNSENLADTGLGDSNGIMALIIVISSVIAIYSARKYNEYKNV